MNASFRQHRPRHSGQRGFGLLEALLCISLMSLLFLGAMTMLLTAGRGVVRTQAQVYSNGDAANAIQNIIGQLREASTFSLPTSNAPGNAESSWTPLSGVLLSQFSTTLNGETINTAMEVVTPITLTPQANGYTANPLPGGLRVLAQTPGGYWQAGPGGWTAPVSTQSPGGLGVADSAVYLIYRGDPDGTPDADPTGSPNPLAGTYLWQYRVPTDSSFNLVKYPGNLTALCKSVASAPNAVQFVRPYYAATGQLPEQNQVEVKIISSYYSPVNGRQTSEETAGATASQLSGKCVYMRDHCTAASSNTTNSGVRTGNNTFQYH